MADFISNEQIVQAARKKLSQATWDYLTGASESETTMRRNRLALDRWGFRPRVLVDVSKVDPSTTLLGQMLRIPVVLAPIGSMQLFDPAGAAASGQAAGDFGTLQVVSSASEPTVEEAVAAGSGPKVYQLYIRGDMAWLKDMITRIKASGYTGFCLTVDTAVISRRERAMLSGFSSPSSRNRAMSPAPLYGAMVTWETLDTIKELTGLPILLKGVGTAEDAALAVDHGVDVVWVSNHGGRQLDHGLGTLDTLPEIVEAVAGRAEIIIDGGFQRGSDVLKAVALGANAVAIGKLQGWGMAAAGKEGVQRVLEILENEISIAMGLLGVTCISELSGKYVCRAEPVTAPHEMSSWANMPKQVGNWAADGRLL